MGIKIFSPMSFSMSPRARARYYVPVSGFLALHAFITEITHNYVTKRPHRRLQLCHYMESTSLHGMP